MTTDDTQRPDGPQRPGDALPSDERAASTDLASDSAGTASLTAARRAKRPRAAAPAIGARGWLRFLWRQLTSMQTALVLLMLLAIAAIPGSLYPQRSVNPGLTDQFLAQNGQYGKILDALGFFDVFSSPWFSAIYLLLFVSLIGCVIPRLITLVKQLRSRPPRTPARLERFVGHQRTAIADAAAGSSAEEIGRRAAAALRRGRYRMDRIEEADGFSFTAERGYLREAGNLLFHAALLAVLVGVALGHLTSYRGQITVVEGEGFSNSLTQYDSFQSGPWYDDSALPPFRFTLDKFTAEFDTTPTPNEFGQPRKFLADMTVTDDTRSGQKVQVQVNKPLHVSGANVYLLGNGYAPIIRVKDAKGNVVADGPIRTISRDRNYTSQLVLKAPDAKPKQIAVMGIFMPTAKIDQQGPHSEFPGLVDPAIAFTVHEGDLGLNSGIPQNAYQVDLSKLTTVNDPKTGSPQLVRLAPGEEATLADGTTVSFLGIKRYAAFDIKHDPFQGATLVAALLATFGLILSLFVPRRRVWVRVRTVDGRTVVESAGLARSEDPRLAESVADLHRAVLGDAAPATGAASPDLISDPHSSPGTPGATASDRGADHD